MIFLATVYRPGDGLPSCHLYGPTGRIAVYRHRLTVTAAKEAVRYWVGERLTGAERKAPLSALDAAQEVK